MGCTASKEIPSSNIMNQQSLQDSKIPPIPVSNNHNDEVSSANNNKGSNRSSNRSSNNSSTTGSGGSRKRLSIASLFGSDKEKNSTEFSTRDERGDSVLTNNRSSYEKKQQESTYSTRDKPQYQKQRSPSILSALELPTEIKTEPEYQMLLKEIRKQTFFNKIHTDKQIQDIARYLKPRTCKAGDYIYRIGDKGTNYYIIEEGSFEIIGVGNHPSFGGERNSVGGLQSETNEIGDETVTTQSKKKEELSDADRKPRVIHIFDNEGSFGEAALRYKFNRSHSVRAITDGKLWTINSVEYQSLMIKNVMEQKSHYISFLRRVPVLAQLTDEQLNALGRCLQRVSFRNKEIIITQGTSGSSFYFIEKGNVICNQRIQKGDNEIVTQVNNYTVGDYFGEGALLTESRTRIADVVAVGDVVCLRLTAEDFQDILGGLQEILDLNFKARVLKGIEYLSNLTDAERSEIADLLVTEEFVDKKTIIKQGDRGDKLYIIKQGEILFTRKTEDSNNKPVEIGRLFTGQVFGEGALLTNDPRRATAVAVGKVTLLSLERNVFNQVFDQSLQDMLNRDFMKRKDFDQHTESNTIEFNDLQNLGILGAGTYGQVLMVTHTVTGKTFALKCMKISRILDMEQEEHIKNERNILSSLNHPFIVNLVHTFKGQGYVFALLDAVLGGELFGYMRTLGRLKVKDAIFFLAQVVVVFEHLHSKNIIYRDLKPENLLLSANGYLRVTDFGLSKRLDEGLTYTLCGTPVYAAPEVYNLSGHGKPVDWWTLGVLAHELITGTTPFDGDAEEIFSCIEQYSRAYPNIRLPRGLNGDVADAVLSLLNPNPNKRLGSMQKGAHEVKHHPMWGNFSWTNLLKQKIKPPYIPKISSMYDTRNFSADNNVRPIDLNNVDSSKVIAGATWDEL